MKRGPDTLAAFAIPAVAVLFGVGCGLVWLAGGLVSQLAGAGWPAAGNAPRLLVGWAQHAGNPALAFPQPQLLPGPAGMWGTLAAVTAVAAAGVGVLMLGLSRRRQGKPSPPPDRRGYRYGQSAAWASRRQLADVTVPADLAGRVSLGYRHGRLIAGLPEHSVLVAGSTRSGKTTGFAVPVILRWHGPAVVCSTKTDLVNLTLHARMRAGEVWVFDPTGVADPDGAAGITTHSWDPLQYARNMAGALQVADAFTDASPAVHDEGSTSYWKDQANAILGALFYTAHAAGLDVGDVLSWCKQASAPEDDGGQFCQAIGYLDGCKHREPEAMQAYESLLYVLRLEFRQRDSAIGTCRAVLAAYDDPRVVAASRKSTIDPQQLLDGTARTLYLVANRQEQKRLAPLFTALLTFVDKALSARANRNRGRYGSPLTAEHDRLLLVLDEVAKLAPMRWLPDLASEIGGEGGALLTIVQDFAQLEQHYRAQWRTVVNNHPIAVALAGIRDVGTSRWFAQNCGTEMVATHGTTSGSDGRRSHSQNERERPVIDEGGVRSLPDMTGLVLYLNRRPFTVALRPYWQDKTLAAMVRPAAGHRLPEEYDQQPVPPANPGPPPAHACPASPASPALLQVEQAPAAGPLPARAALIGALVDGRAEWTGRPEQSPLYHHPDDYHPDGAFYLLEGDGRPIPVEEEAMVFGLRKAMQRKRYAAVCAAWDAGQVDRLGDLDQSLPFRHDGCWYVWAADGDGLHPITDETQIGVCEQGLTRMAAARRATQGQSQ